MDGKVLPQPILVERRAMIWSANYVHGVKQEPRDVAVREVYLYPYEPGERETMKFGGGQKYYIGFPRLPNSSIPHRLRIRAIFKIYANDWTKREGIWSGQVVSPTTDYMVWGLYPQ